jgi:N-acetylglutamate synthase-like GNAT family acetyltransferase
MTIVEPKTPDDFEKYFTLRWEVLRKPWKAPRGSEKAEDDDAAFHALLLHEGLAIGVCRLNLNSQTEGQIRYMAIHPAHQGQGLGLRLLSYHEHLARQMGLRTLMLHAREKAVSFYQRAGYRVIEKSHVLFGEIQHYKMEKDLQGGNEILMNG